MTKPILWTSTRTSGTIVHQMAAVSGLDLDIRFISLRKGDHKTPDFLAINPKGEVAAIQIPDAGVAITEIPAARTSSTSFQRFSFRHPGAFVWASSSTRTTSGLRRRMASRSISGRTTPW